MGSRRCAAMTKAHCVPPATQSLHSPLSSRLRQRQMEGMSATFAEWFVSVNQQPVGGAPTGWSLLIDAAPGARGGGGAGGGGGVGGKRQESRRSCSSKDFAVYQNHTPAYPPNSVHSLRLPHLEPVAADVVLLLLRHGLLGTVIKAGRGAASRSCSGGEGHKHSSLLAASTLTHTPCAVTCIL